MLDLILSFFGYCKIPRETIMISLRSEDVLEELLKQAILNVNKKSTLTYLSEVLEGQKTLTSFLRSGRRLQRR